MDRAVDLRAERTTLYAQELRRVARPVLIVAAGSVPTIIGLLTLKAQVIAELMHRILQGFLIELGPLLAHLLRLIQAHVLQPFQGLLLHAFLNDPNLLELTLQRRVAHLPPAYRAEHEPERNSRPRPPLPQLLQRARIVHHMPAPQPYCRGRRELLAEANVAQVAPIHAIRRVAAVLMEAHEVAPLPSDPVAQVPAGERLQARVARPLRALLLVAGDPPRGRHLLAVAAVVRALVAHKALAGEAGVVGRPAALGAEVGVAGAAADAVAAAVLGGLRREGLPRGVGLGLGGLEVGGRGGGVDELHPDPAGRVGAGYEAEAFGGETDG